MINKEGSIEGTITEALPDSKFRIELSQDKNIIGYLSGKMKLNHIRVLPGDRMRVILDPYGRKTTNRIIERL